MVLPETPTLRVRPWAQRAHVLISAFGVQGSHVKNTAVSYWSNNCVVFVSPRIPSRLGKGPVFHRVHSALAFHVIDCVQAPPQSAFTLLTVSVGLKVEIGKRDVSCLGSNVFPSQGFRCLSSEMDGSD